MHFKTIIEQERSKFVDGKIPSTHIMYDQYMATMDWNGEWTEEQRAFARPLVYQRLNRPGTKTLPIKYEITATTIASERDKMVRIADSMRTSHGWASIRAMYDEYKANGGIYGFTRVYYELRKLGKINCQQKSPPTESSITLRTMASDLDEIGRIADSMRTSQGWASVSAVFKQYQAMGGRNGRSTVGIALRKLGKTNQEPKSLAARKITGNQMSLNSDRNRIQYAIHVAKRLGIL